MKTSCRFFILLALVSAMGIASGAEPMTPQEVLVRQQFDAYNAHDINAFLAPYAEDVELADLHRTWTQVGKTAIRPDYAEMFKNSTLHCDVVDHANFGDTIIDHERVQVTLKDGPVVADAIAIYEIKGGKIIRVTFIEGPRQSQ